MKLYRKSFYIAKRLGNEKPKFLCYDRQIEDYYLIPVTKKFFHPHLVYINGVPIQTAYTLAIIGFKGSGCGIFWTYDKTQNCMYCIALNKDGEIVDEITRHGKGYKLIEKDISILKEKYKMLQFREESKLLHR